MSEPLESGVPAFRQTDQSNDIWSKYKPEDGQFANFMKDDGCRERHWRMKTEFYEIIKKVKPNPAHEIFGFLHNQGKLLAIVTQVRPSLD